MFISRGLRAAAGLFVALLVLPSHTPAQVAGDLPDAFDGIDVVEKFGSQVPMDLVFRNESNEDVALSELFDGKTPVILNFVYHDCPMLCSIVLDALTTGMRDLAWLPGHEYEVLTVSFNPRETAELAASKKRRYLERLSRPEAAAGWHFLVGEQPAITRLTESVGFKYKWDPDLQQYAHPAVLVFLDGEGRVARYLYGIDFPAMQLRSALIETSNGTVGSMMEKLIVSCYMYDPDSQSYTPDIMRIMRLTGTAFLLLLASGLFVFWRREYRRGDRRPETRDPEAFPTDDRG